MPLKHPKIFIPLFIAVLIFSAAWLANIASNTFYIDVGSDSHLDDVYIQPDNSGFYASEKRKDLNSKQDNTFRWTTKEASLQLPELLLLTPWKVTLAASAARPNLPPNQPGTTLIASFVAGQQPQELGRFPLPSAADGTNITFNLPAQYSLPIASGQLQLNSTEVFQPGQGDNRTLAVVLYNLKLEPDYAAYGVKGWLMTLVLPLLVTLIALVIGNWAGLFGAGLIWRSGLQFAAGVLLVFSVLFWQELSETSYVPWTITLWVGWLAFWLARRFVKRALTLPSPFVYAACFMGVLPIIQIVFNRLDLNNWGDVAVATLQSGALLLCVGAYFWAGKFFEPLLVWIFAVAALLSFGCLHWLALFDSDYHGFDFRVNYYQQLAMEQTGAPLYNASDIIASPGSAVRMPPTFTLMYWLLQRFFGENVQAALLVWRIFNELLLIPVILILLKLARELKYRLPIILFLVLGFRQLAFNMDLAQPNIIFLFFLALTALLIKNRREELSGVALAFPIWLKLIPGLLALFYVVERRWRALIGLIAGSLLINALVVAAVGWDNVWYYYTKALWGVNQPEIGLVGQSLWGFVGRLGVNEVQKSFSQNFPQELMGVGYLLAALVLGLTLLVLWRNPARDWLDSLLKLHALLITSLIISPFTWKHYAVMLLGAIVVILVKLSRRSSGGMLVIFGVAYGVLAYDQDFLFLPDHAYGLARLASNDFFFALVGLWALNLWLIWQPIGRKKEAIVTQPEKQAEPSTNSV